MELTERELEALAKIHTGDYRAFYDILLEESCFEGIPLSRLVEIGPYSANDLLLDFERKQQEGSK